MSVLALARPELLKRIAYETASPERRYVRLHANESPDSFGENSFNRYPIPKPQQLEDRLAQLYGVSPDHLLATRGSDDGIDVLIRTFCEAGKDSLVICPPTFGMYKSFAEIQGAKVIEVPLETPDLNPKIQEIVDLKPSPKLIFLCSPNNPTGNLIDKSYIERLCRECKNSVIVLDEAYVEYAPKGSTCIPLLKDYENLVILRTLSKAYGLAGLRCGAVLGGTQILKLLRSVMAPYAIPSPCVDAAVNTLDNSIQERLEQKLQQIRAQRCRLHQMLLQSPKVTQVWNSETNFLLARFQDANEFYAQCLKRGVLVRSFSKKPGLENCIRITVGSTKENDLVMDCLNQD